MTYRAFTAFAGGGAKGIIHVGALKALEQQGVEFLGLAGTSAGAIVACLKAAGFSSDDLFNTDTGETLITRLQQFDKSISTATDLFGKWGWWRIKLFRWTLDQPRWAVILVLLAIWMAPLIGSIVIIQSSVFWSILGVWILLTGSLFLAVRSTIGGLAEIAIFRNSLDKLLQQRMFPSEPDRVVLMSDFGINGRPSLKIVSANLNTRRLQLFSPERTPRVPVADAVAASICLPMVFSPWEAEGVSYIDGGIVSNLPAWPFDEERELDPEALTIAIEIADSIAPFSISRYNWIPAAIRTALFGSGELNLRASGQAEHLILESSLGVLQFDLSAEKAKQEVLDATAAASVKLDKRLFRLPQLYRDACKVVQDYAAEALGSVLAGKPGTIRVALGVQDRTYQNSLRLRYSVGYSNCLDERMLLPIEGSLVGRAWDRREAQFEVAPLPADICLPGEANRLRRKAIWPPLAWELCIPIFDTKGKIRLIVKIDGDSLLPQNDAVAAAVSEVEDSVKDFFSMIIEQLAELEDDNDVE